jgi:hypothetical protein
VPAWPINKKGRLYKAMEIKNRDANFSKGVGTKVNAQIGAIIATGPGGTNE